LKPFFPAVVALVVGIVLGAWQPRGELLAIRSDMDALKAERAKPCRTSAASNIRALLHADGDALGHADAKPEPDEPAEDAAEGDDTDVPGAPPDTDAPPAAPRMTPEDVTAALDARRAQARAALVEQADLDDEQMAAVDAAMDEMNRELAVQVGTFVDAAVSEGDIDRRSMMDLASGALDAVIDADDKMRTILPADVYAEIDDSAVDPFSYISADTLDALVKVQDMPAPDFR
jgi:hypothetical protein